MRSNLLIVLDRSGSMLDVINNDRTKWAIAMGVLQPLVQNFDDRISFGLQFFPNQNTRTTGCGQATNYLKVADDATPVSAALAAAATVENQYYPSSGNADSQHIQTFTNIAEAMAAVSADTGLLASDRRNAVMLVTDGAPSTNCGPVAEANAETVATITALRNQGISTYVVGFGGTVTAQAIPNANTPPIDPVALSSFAEAGGTARPGATKFYAAENAADLEASMQDISSRVALTCSYALDETPPDLGLIYVYFNNEPTEIPRDASHAEGWDSDGQTIQFYGAACQALTSGTVEDLDIVYGCPGPTIS